MNRRILILAALFALAGTATTSVLLHRIDAATAEARLARSESQWHNAALRLELALQRRTLQQLAERGSADDLCRVRTVALRDAITALLRVNVVAFERHPGMLWKEWK